MGRMKIVVLTPQGQAESCMRTQKRSLLGFGKAGKVLEEGVIDPGSFYWIIPYEADELPKITHKLAKGEVFIKRFYRVLIRTLDRANKLADKFQKGIKWVRRWIVKKLKKQYGDNDEEGFIAQVNQMSDDELREFIQITDREAMLALLEKDLITTETLKD